MKIIINQDGIKRSLEGPFEICLSKDDLQTLLSCLRHHEDSHVYGWIVIQDNTVRSTPNSDPIPWYHSDLYPKYPCNYPGLVIEQKNEFHGKELLQRYMECRDSNRWPSYPETLEILSLPEWARRAA
jgi:hypothetical protein